MEFGVDFWAYSDIISRMTVEHRAIAAFLFPERVNEVTPGTQRRMRRVANSHRRDRLIVHTPNFVEIVDESSGNLGSVMLYKDEIFVREGKNLLRELLGASSLYTWTEGPEEGYAERDAELLEIRERLRKEKRLYPNILNELF